MRAENVGRWRIVDNVLRTVGSTFRSPLGRRQLILLMVLLVIPIVLLSIISYTRLQNDAEELNQRQLRAVAITNEQVVAGFFNNLQERLSAAVSLRELRQSAQQLVLNPDDEQATVVVEDIFRDYTGAEGTFLAIGLHNLAGDLVLGVGEDEALDDMAGVVSDPVFNQGINAANVGIPFYDQTDGHAQVHLAVPIFGEQGDVQAVVFAISDLDALDALLQPDVGIGESEDIYLISNEGYFLTEGIGRDIVGQTRTISTEGIDDALDGNNGTGRYDDYRSPPVDVLGAYRWMPQYQMALVAEVDAEEVLPSPTELLLQVLPVAAISFVVALIFAVVFTSGFLQPILSLTSTARRMAEGNLKERVPQDIGRHEIAELGAAFNEMGEQLQELVDELENRVQARIEDLQATLEVGRLATSITAADELLPRLVDTIGERFGLYYTQIYLLDDAKRYAILRAGTGQVGRRLLSQKHRLDMGETSIVARAVQAGESILVSDTQESDIFLPNPMLPQTRSEVAIPLSIAGDILGVLDMQAEQPDTFNQDNLSAFEAMANQLAGVLRTNIAFEETRLAVERADDINRRLTRENWEGYLGRIGAGERIGYEYDLEAPRLLDPERTLSDEVEKDRERTHALHPISLGGQRIGSILVTEDSQRMWSPEEMALVEDVAGRVAQALEQLRAFDETEKRARELAIVAEVSTQAAGTLETGKLLQSVVDLTKESFDLYHAHIYLLDETGQNLVLAAGAGSVGQTMVKSSHSIPVSREHSLVAQSARSQQAVVIDDVTKTPDFLPNPLLPQTRSEMAIPMVVGAQLIGVLDVQASSYNRFTDEDVQIKTTLADQLAIAISNARQFQETQKRATELQAVTDVSASISEILDLRELLQRVVDLTTRSFGFYHIHIYLLDETGRSLDLVSGGGEMPCGIAGTHSLSLDQEHSIVARAARLKESVIDNDVRSDPDFAFDEDLPDIQSMLVIPMTVAERLVGVVELQSSLINRFAEADVRIMTALADQIGVAVQNARSFEQTEKRAVELQVVAEVSAAANTILDQAELLDTVANLTRDRFELYHAHIYLLNNAGDSLELAAGAGQTGRQMVMAGHAIPIDREHSLVAQAARSRQGAISNDVTREPNFLPNPRLPKTKSEMAIPIISGDQLLGVLDVQASIRNRFTDEDVRIKTTLASQIAISLQNARFFEQTERRAVELQVVAEVSAEAATELDTNKLLWDVANLTKERFALYHAHIYLLDPERQALVLAAGAGEAGQQMVASGLEIAVDREQSLVARAARSRQGVIINDVSQEPGWLSNPLLPLTKSEMAIPMILGDRLIGVLDVQSERLNRFTDEDVQIKTTLATQVAIAVQNARSFEQTEKRAVELQVVAEVSAAAATILDPAELLDTVANLTRDRFELYHTHIYLLDSDSGLLELAAGAGNIGKQMVKSGHRIPIDRQHSLVARAARDRIGVVSNNVTREPNFLPNPLLPRTKSEMAIPIVSGEELLGVLDTQSDIFDRFTDEDVRIKTTLAGQIAVALNNARLFTEVTEARFNLGERLKELAALQEIGSFAEENLSIPEYLNRVSERLAASMQYPDVCVAAVEYQDEMYGDERAVQTPWKLSAPINFGQQRYGEIYVGYTVERDFLAEETPHVRAVTDRISTYLESRSLFEQTEKRAVELQVVAEVSAEAATELNTTKLLKNVCDLVKERFDLYHTHIYLLDETGQNLVLVAGAGEAGRVMVAERRSIQATNPHSLVARAARENTGVIANDVTLSPDFLPHPMLPRTQSEMAIPMVAAGDVIGVLDVQADIVDRFTDEDVRIKTTLAGQIAIAVQNARSYEQAQRSAEELSLVADVGAKASSILDPEALVHDIAQMTADSFDLYHIHIFLLQEDGETLWLAAGTGREACHHVGTGYRVHITDEVSLVTHAFREQESVIANNVTFEDEYLPSDFLPDARAEMAIPMLVGDQVVGVIDLQSDQVNSFTETDRLIQTTLATQLAVAIQNARSFDQTQKRAVELQVVAEVGQAATTLLEPSELLDRVANLTRDRFDLYHAHIYLLDETGETLELAAGAGRVGKQMVASGHAIPFDREHSLVARAARSRYGAISNDVTREPDFLPNPRLPKTKSEMAIPVLLGDQLLGVLDVQANIRNRFTDEDVRIKTTLADQIAVALNNARLFTEVAEARFNLGERLKELAALQEIGSYAEENLSLPEYLTRVADRIPSSMQYPEVCVAAIEYAGEIYGDERAIDTAWKLIEPIGFGGQTQGKVHIGYTEERGFLAEETPHIQSITDRVSTYLESRLLFEQTEKRAVELQVVAEVSAASANILDQAELLRSFASLTRDSFNLYHAHVYLMNDVGDELVLAAGAGDVGEMMVQAGHSIPLRREHSLVARAARSGQGVISNDVTQEPNFLPNPLLPYTKSEMAIPIMSGNEILGVLDAQSEVTGRFTEEDVRIKTTLAGQIAIAIQNARAFRRVQEAQSQIDRIYSTSVDMIGTSDMRGYFMTLNPAWERVLGYTPEELMSVPYIEFVHPDDIEGTLAEAEKLNEGATTLQFQNRYRCKDGSYVWLSWNAVIDLEEEVIYFVTRDITEERQRAAEIENLQARLQGILDTASSAVISIDEDQNIILFNRLAEEVFGYEADEVVGQPLMILMPQRVQSGHQRNVKGFQREGTDWRPMAEFSEKLYGRRKNGEEFPIEVAISKLDVDGHPIFTAVLNDITNRREAERRAEQAREIGQQLSTLLNPDELLQQTVVQLSDAFGYYHTHIYLLDHATARLVVRAGLGEAGAQLVAQEHSISYSSKQSIVAQAARSLKPVVVDDVTEYEDFLANPLLSDTRSEVAIPLSVGDRLIGVLDVQHTEVGYFNFEQVNTLYIVANQLAIAISNAELYQEQLETAERLREVDTLKSEFLASMSHELRTPLNSIIGYAEVILDGLDGPINEEMEEDVSAIHSSGRLLLNLINDILDLAKIEAGQMELEYEEIRLLEFLKEIIETSHILVKNKSVELVLDVDPTLPECIYADPIRLQQIINNLLSNAAKFTDEGSITLRSNVDNGNVHIAVVDTGTGIPKEKLEVIFDRFRQADQTSTRRAGGTGLGLDITRRLVHMHGGQIQVDSEVGKGSVFSFVLPVEPTEGVEELE